MSPHQGCRAPASASRDDFAVFLGAALVGIAGLVIAEAIGQHPVLGLLASIALHQFLEPVVISHLHMILI